MECENHPGVEPVARCVSCGKYLCASCVHDRGNKLYCKDCVPGEWEPAHILVSPEDLQVSRAFTYFIEDKRWPQKAVIGTLFMLASLLIVPFFFVLGYELEIVRSVAAGDDHTLPEWTNLGKMFKEGASLFLIGLVYSIPVIIVAAGVSALGLVVGEPGQGGLRGLFIGLAVVGFIMGWLAVVAVKPLFEHVLRPGLLWLLLGGLCYTVGAVFYLCKKLPYHHAVWHLFVLGGSVCHYFAILFYVLP